VMFAHIHKENPVNSIRPLSIRLVSLLLAAAGVAHAQGVGSSGYIRGTVTDPSGSTLPKATVTVRDRETGLVRTVLTGATGQFRVTELPPASYDVTAELSGFTSETHKEVAVALGQTVTSDFKLSLSQVAVHVDVNADPPVVDTERASQSNSVSERYINDLPIDRRDYLTFTLLMPGVSNSNTIADNADFRAKQTPQSGLSFYGSNGRGNSVTVDGGEANDDAGGVRFNVSQDAVREFQINRSNYLPELGEASGASINIVTKAGTNSLHGGLFGFFRNDTLDARDRFAYSPALAFDPTFSNFTLNARGAPVKNTLSRQQFGGTISFPIRKNQTFLFAAYEGLRSDAQDSVPLLTGSDIFSPTAAQELIVTGLAARGGRPVPCITGQSPLPAALCAGLLQRALTVDPTTSPLNAFIVTQFEKDGGMFPFPIRQHQGSLRLDHRFSSSDQAFLRFNYAHSNEADPDVQALTGFSRGTSQLASDSTVQASWFHRFSANSFNEAHAQWSLEHLDVATNDPGGPGLDVQGFGFFGRNIFLPSYITSDRYELADNVSLTRGRHGMKMGVYELIRNNHFMSDTFLPGRFEFLELPGTFLSPCLQAPIACGLPDSVAGTSVNALQSWSLGLPAFYEQGFGNPVSVQSRPFTAAYWQDVWHNQSNFTLSFGLRYELDSQQAPLTTYKKNLAPRVSFAWDPFHYQRTVIRGGYGIFYSPIYAQIPTVLQTLGENNGVRQIANTLVSVLGVSGSRALNSAAIFKTLFSRGKILCGTPPSGAEACITPADLEQFGLTVSNTGPYPPGTVLFSGQPNYRNPQSQQASLGIEQQIANGLSISANYIYVHTTHLPWAVDRNLMPGAPIVMGTGANGLPTNGLAFQDWGAPQCFATPDRCFADPTRTILQDNQYSSVAGAIYQGGIVEVRKAFSDHFTLISNYTYSRAVDDATDFNSDYAPFDEVNLRAERSVSDFDERHKVALAAVLDSPWLHSRILSGFQFSPIVSYHSGHPFNLLAGADINGDGHFTNDRPPGAPRNSGIGPDYIDFDLRLSRKFKLSERSALLFTAEGFNTTNRTNFATVNNVVGAEMAPPFSVRGTAMLSPSQPLGYTAALPQREIQLGARINF
jgi:Carboxypeptidase regulatory-like domain